ncbi:MAG: PAS domain-containing protein [Candidatus Cyclobacteriaceae bacterium M2_1C_046]
MRRLRIFFSIGVTSTIVIDQSQLVISSEQLKVHHDKVNKEADKIVHYFIWGYFFFGLFLSVFYDSYILAVVMGGISMGVYYFFRSLFPGRLLTRLVISFLLWNFAVQFILQMKGMYEMHFFYFISITVLLFYEDWRVMLPAILYAVATFLTIFYIRLSESDVTYLENVENLTTVNAVLHITILLIYGGLAMLWSVKQRRQTQESGIRQIKMEDQLGLMDINIEFANSISQGNLKAEYKAKEADRLGESLMNMRSSLVEAADREEREKFVNVGLATIGDILRSHSDNLSQLCDQLIEKLVDYMKVNQGGIFIIEKDETTDAPFLELKACRAYERKKHLEKRIEMGQGLIGQAAVERERIHLKEVPEDYINITSGLGLATPRSLLIVPLKSNGELVGAIELASFNDFSETDIEFLEKVGESTASTIISVKTNEQTKDLLEQSNQMTEEMQAQEEEMRQNMEEMQATQEEMARTQRELAEKESNLNALLNNTKDTIFALDREYKITVVNKVLKEKYANLGIDLSVGTNILDLLSGDQREFWKAKYDSALGGENKLATDKQGDKYIETHTFPIRDENGNIIGAAVMSRDVTQREEAQEELKRRSKEIREKEARLNALINNTDDSIITIDRNYRVTIMNDVLRNRYRGTQYEKIDVGADALEMLGSERDTWKKYYDQALAGESLNFIIKSTVKGENMWREYFINPIKSHEGNITGASVFSRDVTEKLKAQQEMRQKGQVLYALIDNTTDTYFACDTDYKVIVANKTLRDRFAKTDVDLKEGFNILSVLGDAKEEWKSRYDRAFKGESFMIPQERKVGDTTLFIEGFHGPIKDEDDKIIGAYVISRDITERKKAFDKINELSAEVQELKNKKIKK